MASVDSIVKSINKIEKKIKKNTDDSWNKLKQEIETALEDESSGTDTYKMMASLARESENIPEGTRNSLGAMFDSMSTDEHKHHTMLREAKAVIDGAEPGNKTVEPEVKKVSHQFKIEKLNQDRQIAFGFCLFATDADGNVVVDLQGDTVTPEELESIAYNYVKNHRDVGQMHMTHGEGCVVESFVTTPDKLKAMGIKDKLPIAWWIGLYIEDPEVWAKVKSGEYRAFSIEGEAERVEVDT